MAKTKLIGSDGFLVLGEVGSEYTGDGSQTLDELAGGLAASEEGKGFYQVTAVAASGSAFTWTNAQAKDYFYDDGTLVMAVGDLAIPLPKDPDASIKSFEITLTADKIDTTTLTDKQKTYRMGRDDAAGTMTGITSIGNETISDRFMDRMEVSSLGVKTMNRKNKSPFYFIGYLQGEELSGETLSAIVGKVEPEGFTYGASDGSAQEFSTGFAPTADDRLQKINVVIA